MNEDNFSIKTSNFEGPFDMLLDLIQKKKMSINDISLSSISDEYIAFIKENEMSLSNSTFFVWTAATLMLLKSKSLLPKLALEKDEEDDINELKSRLILLKEIRKNTESIKKAFGKNILYTKIYKKRLEKKFRPDETITLKNILMSLDGLVSRSPLVEKIPEVEVKKVRSLKEITDSIKERINRFLKISFSELVAGTDKKETSISFLAILELYRNGLVDLKQEESFGKIMVEKNR